MGTSYTDARFVLTNENLFEFNIWISLKTLYHTHRKNSKSSAGIYSLIFKDLKKIWKLWDLKNVFIWNFKEIVQEKPSSPFSGFIATL